MLGGLDWTDTALGRAFKSQEQVLFLFAAIIFIISVTLHMLSIPEQPFTPARQLKGTEDGDYTSQLSLRPLGHTPPSLDIIGEEDAFTQDPSREDNESDPEEGEMNFLSVERVRSKSDSVLAMPDATIQLDPDLNPDAHHFLSEVHPFLPETQQEVEDAFLPSDYGNGLSLCPPYLPPAPCGTSPPADGMVDLEPRSMFSPQPKEHKDGPPPPLVQISPSTENTLLNTQVIYSCYGCRFNIVFVWPFVII